MESMTFGTGMDERDVTPEEAVRVPQPRTWSDDPGAAYRRLFDAAAQSPQTEETATPRPRRSRRRTRRILATVLVLLLLLGGGVAGAFAWTAHARKQPALDALRSGNDAFEPVASALRRATDLTGLRTAAEGAGAAATEIDRAARPVSGGSTALESRVRDVLRDEAALLRAADDLTTLTITTLGTWPAIRDTMGDAEAALDSDVKTLAGTEPEAARQVRTGRGLAGHSDEVVGDFAGSSIVDLLDTRLEALVSAQTTADLRRAAAATGQSSEIVKLALEGVAATSDQGVRISHVGDALAAIARLKGITGQTLGSWPAIRTALASATAGVEGVDPRNALIAVDGLVARAGQQLTAWQNATAAATAKARKDSAALTAYTTAVGEALSTMGEAGAAQAAFAAKVTTDQLTNEQAVGFLDGAARARAAVSTALAGIKAPKPLGKQHAALVAVADQAAQVVAAAREGSKKAKCGTVPPVVPGDKPTPAPCLYADAPGFGALTSGQTAVGEAYATAKGDWDEAVAAATQAIADRKLPAKPVV